MIRDLLTAAGFRWKKAGLTRAAGFGLHLGLVVPPLTISSETLFSCDRSQSAGPVLRVRLG